MAGRINSRDSADSTVRDLDVYLERKRREIAVLESSLKTPLRLQAPVSPSQAIEQKLKLAATLRAERSLQNWSVTETARPATRRWRSGGFEFSYDYQRADLSVRGPPIYGELLAREGARTSTVYTGSGMSAIATLLVSLIHSHRSLDMIVSSTGYGETHELMRSFGDRLRIVPFDECRRLRAEPASMRALWLDSAVEKDFLRGARAGLPCADIVVFDTTCYWRGSARIRRIADMARGRGLPIALVRSHAKLDGLGIEYGRLGSIVVASNGAPRVGTLVRRLRDTVRLFGAAPVPVHFAPFALGEAFERCSRERTASIVYNTRRLERRLRAALDDASAIMRYQHGLYITVALRGAPGIEDVKKTAADLARSLSSQGLPVAHAGSFGFDFVALEWFPDPLAKTNVLRIAGGDLPAATVDHIAEGIATWWSRMHSRKPTRKARGLRVSRDSVTARR